MATIENGHHGKTYAHALEVLTAMLNGACGQRRMELAETNDPQFSAVREIEQHFMFHPGAPDAEMTPDDEAMLAELEGILGAKNPSGIGATLSRMGTRVAAAVQRCIGRPHLPQRGTA